MYTRHTWLLWQSPLKGRKPQDFVVESCGFSFFKELNMELQVNTNIAVSETDQTVSARELHVKLEITERFSRWFDSISKYGFEENQDFTSVRTSTLVNNGAERELQDYRITIEMAKQICMLQRSENGRKYREYFLKLEKAWNSPEMVMKRALQIANQKVEEMKERLFVLQPKADLADALVGSNGAISMAEAVKILELPFGRNTAYSLLRDKGILQADNIPYQEYINRRYFRVRESLWKDSEGKDHITLVTEVYQKGMEYLKAFFEDCAKQ